MKNNNKLLISAICLIAIPSAAQPQKSQLSIAESSYHGRSKEVMELFRELKEGFGCLIAEPRSNGLRIAPGNDSLWDGLSPEMKDFLQCLLDEVVSNKLNVAAHARICVRKYSRDQNGSDWHLDGDPRYVEFRSLPRTLISFSDSQEDLATRFSALTPPVDPANYSALGAYLIEGIREGDFASGDLARIYHRGPTEQELGSSQRLLIDFQGKVFTNELTLVEEL